MTKYTKEVKVGLIALLTAVIFYFGFRYLKGVEVFSLEKSYYLHYSMVTDLEVSSPVLLNGMTVGKVRAMQHVPERNHEVEVEISLKNDLLLTKGTVGELQDAGLLGGKVIALFLPNTEATHSDGDTLISRTQATVMDLIADTVLRSQLIASVSNLNQVLTNVSAISGNMIHTTEQFDSLSTSLNHLVADNDAHIGHSLKQFAKASSKLNKTLSESEALLKDLRQGIKAVDTKTIGSLVQQLEGTFGGLNLLLDTLNKGKSTLGKLLSEDSLYTQLNLTFQQITGLLTQLQAHPKDFLAPFGRSEKSIARRKKRKEQKARKKQK